MMENLNFKSFLERDLHGVKKHPENYLNALSRELSIDPNSMPDFIDVPQAEFTDENLLFNQVILQVIKPISLDDPYIRVKLYSMKSPDLNQHVYQRRDVGGKNQIIPYEGSLQGIKNKVFLIPIDKFSSMVTRGWEGNINKMASGII